MLSLRCASAAVWAQPACSRCFRDANPDDLQPALGFHVTRSALANCKRRGLAQIMHVARAERAGVESSTDPDDGIAASEYADRSVSRAERPQVGIARALHLHIQHASATGSADV